MFRSKLAFLFLLAISVAAPQSTHAQSLDSATVAGFRWRSVGPAAFGGRVSDVVGIPSPSKTFYVASVAGGIFKTTNSGTTFQPLFDQGRVASMGMLAIAPSDTNQIWAGTGEPNSRNTIEPGGGVFKSMDGGHTWKFMGLKETQQIGRIIVHPTNPNIVYVAALGHAWGPNPERGLYKTEDGGNTWKQIKFVSDKAGFVDVAMDPSNPNTLLASSWERLRGPYFLTSGGPGSALWKSADGGNTWNEVKGGGFPETTKGRISISYARSNPRIVYSMVEADSMRGNNHPLRAPASDSVGTPRAPRKQRLLSGLYRSDDGGSTWRWMNENDTRPFYYSQVRADTKNPDRVYFSSTPLLFSDDGGKTARSAAQNVHVDTHGFWIDPNDPEHFIVGNDGGIAQTWDRGGNYDYFTTLPIGQFYEITYDYAFPYNICGGAQDNGAWCGPSRRKQTAVTNVYWFTISGGDGFYTAQDPNDPHLVWGESQGGNVSRLNTETGERVSLAKPNWRPHYKDYEDSIVVLRGDTTRSVGRDVEARIAALRAAQKADSAALDMRYNWNTPYFISAHNPKVFYMGGNRVLKSMDRGDGLFPISPDLSTMDQAKINVSLRTTGGISNDATGAETYCTVVALAESYIKAGWLYAGTDDGNVWSTRNDGATWESLNGRFPGLPKLVYVNRIEPSHFDTNTFYIAFDNHRVNDFSVYLYVTTDAGKTFKSIANDLPTGSADWVHVIREDPFNRDLLFVGTSVGAYASIDRGAHWTKFMTGLPTTPVFDLKVHPRDHELMAATHGRSFWVVDVAGLEQVNTRTLAENAHLFKPPTSYQYGQGPAIGASGNGEAQRLFTVPSPAYGANISYHVGAGLGEPVNLVITDVSGDTIARLSGPNTPGVHTVTWDYRATRPPQRVALSPSELRDSVRQVQRTAHVLDSLQKAGTPAATVTACRDAATGGGAGRGGRGGGGGGGGGGGRGGRGGADVFVARPAEGPVAGGGRGAGGAGGEGAAAFDPTGGDPAVQECLALITPAGGRGGRGGGGGGGGRGGGGGGVVASGDYLVSLTIGGRTQKQVLRVERVSGGEDAGGGGGGR